MSTHWRLPRGVDELLPPRAWQLEQLRRRVLDLYITWGFAYIEPPVIEYLDSLLVGSGEDLDLQTLKVVDQISGRQLGVRADMTSQALRIDAHSLPTDEVQRLCYAGPVIFANPQISNTSRVPFKAGAEIFGAASLSADVEVVNLMLATVTAAGIEHPVLLLGHMGIYRALVDALEATGGLVDEPELFRLIQRKSRADIAELLASADPVLRELLSELPRLMGVPERLEEARKILAKAPEPARAAIDRALNDLADLVQGVRALHPEVTVRLDVSELSGYGYHSGPVFAVYHPELGEALAQGGRYDGVGEAFGRQRAATGFDVNLKALLGMSEAAAGAQRIFSPFSSDASDERSEAQMRAVAQLRNDGHTVQSGLSTDEGVPSECTHVLQWVGGQWEVVARS